MTDQRTFAEELAPHFAAEQLAQIDPSTPHVMPMCLDCGEPMTPDGIYWACKVCGQVVKVSEVAQA